MLGGMLGVQELLLLGAIFGLVVVLPVTIIIVVVYCLRRDSQNQGGA
jgi:hypothetical protein